MTQQRHDSHSTEFGLWLRNQSCIDSKGGYVATNLDYSWRCYRQHDKHLLMEEKRFCSVLKHYQIVTFKILDKSLRTDDLYHGFHLLIFEKTNPEDGRVCLDEKIITKDDLLEFLMFKKPDDWYRSYFPPPPPYGWRITRFNFDDVGYELDDF